METYIMSLDQGTTSCRCILFNRAGEIVSVAQKEFHQYYPQPGWVEHDPMEIWSTQIGVAQEAMYKVRAGYQNIAAIGITNQRETTVLWDKETGRPVYNAIVWQCRRTAVESDRLKEAGHAQAIREKTGLFIDAYFSATKIRWILDRVPEARELLAQGRLLFGTIDTWLVWNLTGGKVHATDYSNAARTMLFNINTLQWDKDILQWLEIPACILPEVVSSSGRFGVTDSSIFGGEILIGGAAGDQQAALFGQACFAPGTAKNTYGTGCFLLMNTGTTPMYSQNGLLTTIAWGIDGRVEYALEGSVFVAGAAIQWLRDEMKLLEASPDSEAAAESVCDTAGVYIVPAFTGIGAPYWNPYVRGTITGISRGAGRNHLIRAALESLAYQTCDVLSAMEEDSRVSLRALKVDGGACANNFLMQFQADMIGVAVERPPCIETTALGAAYLAGLACGYWKSKEDIIKNISVSQRFEPKMDQAVREQKRRGWRRAVKAALAWAEEEESV